jgi:hypothetical protein
MSVVRILACLAAVAVASLKGLPAEEERAFPGKIDVLPWPEGKGPGGFMSRVELARIEPGLSEAIVASSKAERAESERPATDVRLTTPLEACRFLGGNMNMATAPCYVVAYPRNDKETYYVFSGGTTGRPVRDFSRGVVLTANGGIRQYTMDWKSFHRFALFLVKKHHAELDKVELETEPVLTEKDIISYDWATHTMELTEDGIKKLPSTREVGVNGRAFVIVADGKRCYRGAFWTSFSSLAHPNPVIDVLRGGRTTRKIERASFLGSFAKGDDPRSDKRVHKALEEAGKLRAVEKGGKEAPRL